MPQAGEGFLRTNLDFNANARFSARWTASKLTPEDAQYLAALPHVVRRNDFTLVHGSLRSPVLEYLLSDDAAAATFKQLETRFCLVGHSHIPFVCREGDAQHIFEEFPEGIDVPIFGERLIINPGGVGQPRDQDPRPSYAIYDTEGPALHRHRVAYEIAITQEKMRQANLPEALINRLTFGV